MTTEYFDVVIIGAGLSGIGAAYHLQDKCPGKSYVILEGREAIGGTWDLFRYPGIRSDSDMYTLGYNFKPWTAAKAIADGPSILEYVRETAVDYRITPHIRYQHWVTKAAWNSHDATWTVEANHNGKTVQIRGNFLWMCSGYYNYEEGYTPEFNGRSRFQGQIVHPQKWPQGLDYRGKKVVVIGSGATAVTLVPAMADEVKHITMLQRSPTYIATMPDEDATANTLRQYLPEKVAYSLIRLKNITFQQLVYHHSRLNPAKAKQIILDMVRDELGPDYDIATHFTPNYNPWDQRLCLVPNSDLFKAIKSGKASVVTDHIETFTETGILLQSGQELEADIIVTATGLNLIVLGGIEVSVNGQPIDFAQTFLYKGMMYSGVPNLISTFGYTNASWTLRTDLIADYTCRLLNHMQAIGASQCTPHLRPQDQNMAGKAIHDGFTPNYIQRALKHLPQQGDYAPWSNRQSYLHDIKVMRYQSLTDDVLQFTNPPGAPAPIPITDSSTTRKRVAAGIGLLAVLLLWRVLQPQKRQK